MNAHRRCHYERRCTWLTLAAQVGLSCLKLSIDVEEIDIVSFVGAILDRMRREGLNRIEATVTQMALDHNSKARLALARAWDLILERKAA